MSNITKAAKVAKKALTAMTELEKTLRTTFRVDWEATGDDIYQAHQVGQAVLNFFPEGPQVTVYVQVWTADGDDFPSIPVASLTPDLARSYYEILGR